MADSPSNSTSSPEYFFVREERISDMVEFSRMLAVAIVNFAKGDVKITQAIGANISTHCPRCEIRLNGDEVLALSQSDEQEKRPKVQRMQLGYCPRNGCDASSTEVCFHRHPDVDWPAFFLQMNVLKNEETKTTEVVPSAEEIARRKARWQTAGRVAIGLAVIGLLLMVWQWRRGGRIPYLREPEKFRVTPRPTGQPEHPRK